MHRQVHPLEEGSVLEQGKGGVLSEGGVQGEEAAAGADEAAKVRAGSKRLAKVTRKSPNVGAFGASNADNRLRQPQGRCIRYVYACRWR